MNYLQVLNSEKKPFAISSKLAVPLSNNEVADEVKE